MTDATGNATSGACTTNSKSQSLASSQNNGYEPNPKDVNWRLQLHERVHVGAKCDLETPASILGSINIKQLLTNAAFDSLPGDYQDELIRLLPESDIITDSNLKNHMTVNALSNEFFAKSCVEYRDRLKNGEFSGGINKSDADPVVWEPDIDVLRENKPYLGVPKAGKPFICSKKHVEEPEQPPKKKARKLKSTKSTQPLVKAKPSSAPITPQEQQKALAKKAISKAKALAVNHTKAKAVTKPNVQNGTIPAPVPVKTLQKPVTKSPETKKVIKSESKSCTELEKLATPTKPPTPQAKPSTSGIQLVRSPQPVRVVQIPTIRKPHGQVVTTLANCNSLLVQMIRRPMNTVTQTAPPPKANGRILPTILRSKKSTPIIVTLQGNNVTKKPVVPSTNGVIVNKAVSAVLSKISNKPSKDTHSTQPVILPITNGNTSSTMTLNGAQGTMKMNIDSDRSRGDCKMGQPKLNLERSYQICKQVLGPAGGPNLVSLIGGKKDAHKPVRKAVTDLLSKHCDIPVYRAKHRSKPGPALTSHVFLALKEDDGYVAKAYKKRAAFRLKTKKKALKAKKQSETPASSPADVTAVTDSIQTSIMSVNNNNSLSLLSRCMCANRAMVICQKCGAFSHAECMSKELCLACSPIAER